MSKQQQHSIIAMYGQTKSVIAGAFYQKLIDEIKSQRFRLLVHAEIMENYAGKISFPPDVQVFSTHEEIAGRASCLFSIGGDGTLLNALPLVKNSGIPILGFNTGRLGFLSSISEKEISEALQAVSAGDYIFDERTILQLDQPQNYFPNGNYALNEITVHKKETSSMINIHAWVNGLYLNTYWADGLIVATPTGSTAYSLSCGGPILMPDTGTLILTPIAPHNLTVRPIVIPGNSKISLRAEGRSDHFLVSLDSTSKMMEYGNELMISQSPFRIRLLQMKNRDFFTTIREKLMWGIDKRN